jgi:serine/threonine protein kinase
MVRKKDTNKIYALKILKKKVLQLKKQEFYTITERNVLIESNHPFIINLYSTF